MMKMEKCMGYLTLDERQIIHDWIAGNDHSSNVLAYSRALNTSQRYSRLFI